ncbi:MAG: hypothetical protein GY746_11135 [Gammaproteobacteria bacterium]|nr:hypothetical protein [Gammaproteobacteria bacterium]
MATLASVIIDKVRSTLQDITPGGMRYKDDELLGWLNSAQTEIAFHKPEATSKNMAIPLAAGTLQYLPQGGIQFLKLDRNENNASGTAPGRAIRVSRSIELDTATPDWHTQPGSDTIFHYVFNEDNPDRFYVYPPSDSSGTFGGLEVNGANRWVRAVFSVAPTPVAAVTDYIDVPDVFANIIMDYILFRAYGKDATFAGNPQRSTGHYQMFATALGVKLQIEQANSPNVTQPEGM